MTQWAIGKETVAHERFWNGEYYEYNYYNDYKIVSEPHEFKTVKEAKMWARTQAEEYGQRFLLVNYDDYKNRYKPFFTGVERYRTKNGGKRFME